MPLITHCKILKLKILENEANIIHKCTSKHQLITSPSNNQHHQVRPITFI